MQSDDRFKITLELRNMEIQLYWQRSNFFLALNTAIAVGFFSQKDPSFTLPLSILGFSCSFLWFLVNLGSKFWQARWEEKLRDVETEVAPELKMFTEEYSDIRRGVERNLRRQATTIFGRMVMSSILRKPAVSTLVIYLSLLFDAFWLYFIVHFLWENCHG